MSSAEQPDAAGRQPATPPTIAERLATARKTIAELAIAGGRSAQAVTLIAVSKKHPATVIREAHAAGQLHFAENYLQEAEPKLDALTDLPLTWHYIGRIQSNKTRTIAQRFDWVHTVDREKIARRLSEARAAAPGKPPLNICLQVNIDADPNKAGVQRDAVAALAAATAELPDLCLRGLMTILDPTQNPADSFAAMKRLFDELAPRYGWDTLSMGMSGDYADAIRNGATQVRLGTALFGARPATEDPQPPGDPA